MHQPHPNATAAPRHSFWRLYMGVWIVLAGASLAYLVLFSQNPDARRHVIARIQTDFATTSPAPVAERVPAPEVNPEATDKVRALNEELESLRQKLKQAQENPQIDRSPPVGAPANDSNGGDETITSAATEPPPGTSSVTTASIPRPEEPVPAEPPAATYNPFASTDNVVVGGEARSVETTPVAPATTPEATPAATPPATVATTTPPRRNLRGQNFAIRPLRPGQLPPLPSPQSGRSAMVAPPVSQPTRTAGSILQPTVLNGDSEDARPQAPRTNATRALTPQPTPTSFGAATVRRAPSPSALVLSSASSITGLKASWLLLSTEHGPALSSLQPRYVADPTTGTYRLLAGPVSSRAEADRLCSDLIGQGVRCGVTAYDGSPL